MWLIVRNLMLVLCFCCASARAAVDEMGIDLDAAYSATRIIQSSDGELEIREHRAPGRYRMEFQVEGETMVHILREAEGEAYMLVPSARMAMAVPVLRVRELSGELDILERVEEGREQIDGHDTTRYRAKFRDPRGGIGEGRYWVTDEGIPIRIDMSYQDGSATRVNVLMDLQDLQVGPQEAALFLVPDDYQILPGIGAFPGASATD